jgi:hypothetical protein
MDLIKDERAFSNDAAPNNSFNRTRNQRASYQYWLLLAG